MRTWMLTTAAAMLAAAWGCAAPAVTAPAPQENAEGEDLEMALFDYLMTGLESDSYQEREDAMRGLIRQGKMDLVVDVLKRTKDPETKWRLKYVRDWNRNYGVPSPVEVIKTPNGWAKRITLTTVPRPEK